MNRWLITSVGQARADIHPQASGFVSGLEEVFGHRLLAGLWIELLDW
jgi:hypothetical protein